MKKCPVCTESLPETAHFCPKCGYVYPKAESVFAAEEKKRIKKKTILLSLLVLAVLSLAGGGIFAVYSLRREMQAYEEEQDQARQEWMDRMFRTGEELSFNEEIACDFRDSLVDYETLCGQMDLGAETQEAYEDEGYIVHVYDLVKIYTTDYGEVVNIEIDYSNADEGQKKSYGVFGYNADTQKEQVREDLGSPDQNYGEEEYYYRFDGRQDAPALYITWDENDRIAKIQYYRILQSRYGMVEQTLVGPDDIQMM